MKKPQDFYSRFTTRPELIEDLKSFAVEQIIATLALEEAIKKIDPESFLGRPTKSVEFVFDLEDRIADLFEIPKDNTIELDPSIHYGDNWPDWAYCRDWITELIGEAKTPEQIKAAVDQIARISLNGHEDG